MPTDAIRIEPPPEVAAAYRETLGFALDLAYSDQEHYLRYGSPEIDHGDEWPEAKANKITMFRETAKMANVFQLHGEAHRWTALTDELEGIKRCEICGTTFPTDGYSLCAACIDHANDIADSEEIDWNAAVERLRAAFERGEVKR